MAFSGPSGHGKTELAIQLGDLLSVKHKIIDWTHLHYANDLLGGASSYQGALEGSVLNNFIADNDGKRAVVFFDGFAETT
jgi:ATP-dependent Clp protease ATP-binding subunit ClpB